MGVSGQHNSVNEETDNH